METKEVALKDGRKAKVSPLRIEDKERVVRFFSELTPDVLTWALPPYDRPRVERYFGSPETLTGLIAEVDGSVVGYLQLIRFGSRQSHAADLMIYLSRDCLNIGLGTEMMRASLSLAKERGLHRVGLTVIDGNANAVHVYEKVGFKVEGRRVHAYKGVDGSYHDALEMGLLLD